MPRPPSRCLARSWLFLMRAAISVPPVLVAAGCACSPSAPVVEDFEGCTGACGFTIAGAGTASVVSTIHPGEHGLRIEGDVTADRSLPKSASIDGTYILSLVADCPAGLQVSLRITTPGGAEQALPVTLALDDAIADNGQPPDYSGASYLPLVGAVTLPTGVASTSVEGLSLHAAPGKPCTVDLIKLSSAAQCVR